MDHRYRSATTADRSPRARHPRPVPARPLGPWLPQAAGGRQGHPGAVALAPRPVHGPPPAGRPGARPPARPVTGRPGPPPPVAVRPPVRPVPAMPPAPPRPLLPAPAPVDTGRHRTPHRAAPAVRVGGLASLAAGAVAAALPAVPALLAPAPTTTASTTMVLQAAEPTTPAAAPRMIAPLAPVLGDGTPEPPQLRVSDLVKAAGMAEDEQRRVAREAAAHCAADLDGLGAVKPWVRAGARFLSCLYDEPTLHGVASRGGNYSDHPSGHAVDLMTGRERGDRIAACVLDNQDEMGVEYVIWRQRVNYGDGWEPMADRGGATANHFDHVHVSFERSAPDGDPSAGSCD